MRYSTILLVLEQQAVQAAAYQRKLLIVDRLIL
jgi:hypothetical protein